VGGKVFAGKEMERRLATRAQTLAPEGSGGFGEVGGSGFWEDDIWGESNRSSCRF
jgi:hypothetical protein